MINLFVGALTLAGLEATAVTLLAATPGASQPIFAITLFVSINFNLMFLLIFKLMKLMRDQLKGIKVTEEEE